MKNEIVLFTDGDINLEVELSPELETVWLTQKQMEELFDVKHATVSEHISNILASRDETSVGFSDKSSGGRKPKIYNLDMICLSYLLVIVSQGSYQRSREPRQEYECRK